MVEDNQKNFEITLHGIMEIFRYSQGHKAASNKVRTDPLSYCNMDSNQGRIYKNYL